MMKLCCLMACASLLVLPHHVGATTQNSTNYTINGGRIVSGGTAVVDSSGMTIIGSTIGQVVSVPPGGISSPAYGSKTVVLAAVAAVQSVTVSTLPDGATTAASPLVIYGVVTTAPFPKSLTINGTAVTVHTDGSFSMPLPLTAGTNSVCIVSTSQSGQVTTQTRTITYNPSAPPVSLTTVGNNDFVPLSQTTVPLTGTVGANVQSVSIMVNGGQLQTVTPVNGAFTATSGTLAPGINTITVTTTTAGGSTSSVVVTVWRGNGGSALIPTGDLNNDGTVDIADALLALQIASGSVPVTSQYLINGDVAPFINGKPSPDGAITTADALIILRKIVGLVSW